MLRLPGDFAEADDVVVDIPDGARGMTQVDFFTIPYTMEGVAHTTVENLRFVNLYADIL
jgi:hypothetical protein